MTITTPDLVEAREPSIPTPGLPDANALAVAAAIEQRAGFRPPNLTDETIEWHAAGVFDGIETDDVDEIAAAIITDLYKRSDGAAWMRQRAARLRDGDTHPDWSDTRRARVAECMERLAECSACYPAQEPPAWLHLDALCPPDVRAELKAAMRAVKELEPEIMRVCTQACEALERCETEAAFDVLRVPEMSELLRPWVAYRGLIIALHDVGRHFTDVTTVMTEHGEVQL